MKHEHRAGAKQPDRFNPASAARLDDPARFAYLAPSAVATLLELRDDLSVLDFGAGTGTYAVELARAFPQMRVIALDEQTEMLELLRVKTAAADLRNIETVDATAIAALDGSIDRILALNVLHELGDEALLQMRSLLCRTGFAVVIDWNADVERPHGPPNEHVYGVDEARRRLEANGFLVRATSLFAYHYAIIAESRDR